jgi:hypothetical protein
MRWCVILSEERARERTPLKSAVTSAVGRPAASTPPLPAHSWLLLRSSAVRVVLKRPLSHGCRSSTEASAAAPGGPNRHPASRRDASDVLYAPATVNSYNQRQVCHHSLTRTLVEKTPAHLDLLQGDRLTDRPRAIVSWIKHAKHAPVS